MTCRHLDTIVKNVFLCYFHRNENVRIDEASIDHEGSCGEGDGRGRRGCHHHEPSGSTFKQGCRFNTTRNVAFIITSCYSFFYVFFFFVICLPCVLACDYFYFHFEMHVLYAFIE